MSKQAQDKDFLDPLVEDSNWLNNSIQKGTWSIDSSYIDFNTLSVNTGGYQISTGPVVYPVNITDKGISMDTDADIKIGNLSLKDSIKRIEERLNILTVNHELEKDWEELRALGQKYRELEKDIMDKMSVWNVLSKD